MVYGISSSLGGRSVFAQAVEVTSEFRCGTVAAVRITGARVAARRAVGARVQRVFVITEQVGLSVVSCRFSRVLHALKRTAWSAANHGKEVRGYGNV